MTITFVEFISVFGASVIVIFGAWINSKIAVAKLQTEVENIKQEIKEEKFANSKAFEKIDKKLDEIMNKLIEHKHIK